MPTETAPVAAEHTRKTEYSHKSFELVYSNFCSQYADKIKALTGQSPDDGERFLGLAHDASPQQMGRRLSDVGSALGTPEGWDEDQIESISDKDAVIFSARYLAWNAVMGGLTQQYAGRLQHFIDREKFSRGANGSLRHNIHRIARDRKVAVSLRISQNQAMRDYFDSGLAKALGNDSPEKMDRLLSGTPYLRAEDKESIVRGVSLEIASKRYLESQVSAQDLDGVRVAFGNDAEDAAGGDIVLEGENEVLHLDIKSSMPEVFSNGERSDQNDFDRGYKLIDDDGVMKFVVWAYNKHPVGARREPAWGHDQSVDRSAGFILNDQALEHSLRQVLGWL